MMQPEEIPRCDFNDPAALDAWFGRAGLYAHWRKVVLALAREMSRAALEATNRKYTEAKVDDMARLNPIYVDFLLNCLEGARLREKAWRDAASGGYGA